MMPRYLPDRLGFGYPFDECIYVIDDYGNARRVPCCLPEDFFQSVDEN